MGRGSVQADFARQLAERNAKAYPQKKPRASAPKGTKLAAGYTDRTKERVDEEDSDIAKRIKNLEEVMKLGQIDRETYEKLVSEITGGEVSTTHLVKGLDRKLLERVRRGEDVLGGNRDSAAETEEHAGGAEDLEDAFDELAEAHVGSVTRDKVEKKGERLMAPPLPVAGAKRTRADILAELKRQREEAARAAEAEHEKRFPTLGPGFRKITAQGEQSRIEVDEKGREILIVTGPDGKEKRKVRKQKTESQPPPEIRHDLDDVKKPINMNNLPTLEKQEESEDDDIFAGVGSNYNPLAEFGDDDDSSDSAEEDAAAPDATATKDTTMPQFESVPQNAQKEGLASEATDPERPVQQTKRDYFRPRATQATTSPSSSSISAADATVRAALAKVRSLDERSTLLQNLSSADTSDADSKEARLKKRAAELAASDRDMEDIDMGFGESRFDDADEMDREGEKVKFSEWKGLGAGGDEDDDEDGLKGAKKRKRGPKKRKGDVNNADDVLKAMERQREKKTKTLG